MVFVLICKAARIICRKITSPSSKRKLANACSLKTVKSSELIFRMSTEYSSPPKLVTKVATTEYQERPKCPIDKLFKKFRRDKPVFDPSEPREVIVGFQRGLWSYKSDLD